MDRSDRFRNTTIARKSESASSRSNEGGRGRTASVSYPGQLVHASDVKSR